MTVNANTEFLEGDSSARRPLLDGQQDAAHTSQEYDPAEFPLASAPPASSSRGGVAATPQQSYPVVGVPANYPPITTAYVGGGEGKPGKHVEDLEQHSGSPVPPAPYPPLAGAPPPPVEGYPVNAPLPITVREQVWLVQTQHTHMGPVTCPHCRHSGAVRRTREVGTCAWLSSISLCLLGFWPCFWLPFCCDCTKDKVYSCPNCGAELCRVL